MPDDRAPDPGAAQAGATSAGASSAGAGSPETPSTDAPSADTTTVGAVRARGMTRRRQVLGDAHVDRAERNKTDFDASFQEFITRYAWGEAWQRTAIDTRTRHLVVLALMAALGREEEFVMHVRAMRNTGVKQEELQDVLHLVAIYAGLPLANGAFRLAKDVLAQDQGAAPDDRAPRAASPDDVDRKER